MAAHPRRPLGLPPQDFVDLLGREISSLHEEGAEPIARPSLLLQALGDRRGAHVGILTSEFPEARDLQLYMLWLLRHGSTFLCRGSVVLVQVAELLCSRKSTALYTGQPMQRKLFIERADVSASL
jgi:hypothetical protein